VLGPEDLAEGVDRRTGIGMWIEPARAFGADAAPLADQEGAAEQIGPDLHPVVAPFVQRRADADERGRFGKQRQLGRRRPDGGRHGAGGEAGGRSTGGRGHGFAIGHIIPKNVTSAAWRRQRNRPREAAIWENVIQYWS
jgi:hypothetical protein